VKHHHKQGLVAVCAGLALAACSKANTTTTPPPAPDGVALYAAKCASCHGPLSTSAKLGRTTAQITAASMTQGLSTDEVQAIAAVLASTPTPPAQTVDQLLGGIGSESIAVLGGGTADKLWIMDAKYHRNITSIAGEGNDGRHLPRISGAHNWNYPDLHDTHAIVAKKDFSRLYTVNWFSYDENSYALEFDPKTFKETRRVSVGKGGHHAALSPDDKYLYVANQYSTFLSVIDVATFTKIKDIELGGMVVYPTPTMYWDGVPVNTPYIFVTVTGPPPIDNTTKGTGTALNAVAVIDVQSNTLVTEIPIGTSIHGVNLTPDGKEVWVAQPGGESSKSGVAGTGDVTVIDVATLNIKRRVKIGGGGVHIVFDRLNKYAFVTGGGKLWKIDRSTYGVVWGVPTETGGAHLAVSPDNREVWTVNHGMNATRYPYMVGGLAPCGVQVFSADDGSLITEMVTEAVSHEIQFIPRSALGLPSGSTAKSGADVYAGSCAVCHGAGGAGGDMGPPLNTGKWLNKSAVVQAYITTGTPALGMPAYGGNLSAADLQSASDYVASLTP
jgi:YVTN family beta-propeller protein